MSITTDLGAVALTEANANRAGRADVGWTIIDLTIAVIVDAIAQLGRRVARLRVALGAVRGSAEHFAGAFARTDTDGAFSAGGNFFFGLGIEPEEVVVGHAVAVVVGEIADLARHRAAEAASVAQVFVDGAVAVVIEVVADFVRNRATTITGVLHALVGLVVAVIVDVVAGFCGREVRAFAHTPATVVAMTNAASTWLDDRFGRTTGFFSAIGAVAAFVHRAVAVVVNHTVALFGLCALKWAAHDPLTIFADRQLAGASALAAGLCEVDEVVVRGAIAVVVQAVADFVRRLYAAKAIAPDRITVDGSAQALAGSALADIRAFAGLDRTEAEAGFALRGRAEIGRRSSVRCCICRWDVGSRVVQASVQWKCIVWRRRVSRARIARTGVGKRAIRTGIGPPGLHRRRRGVGDGVWPGPSIGRRAIDRRGVGGAGGPVTIRGRFDRLGGGDADPAGRALGLDRLELGLDVARHARRIFGAEVALDAVAARRARVEVGRLRLLDAAEDEDEDETENKIAEQIFELHGSPLGVCRFSLLAGQRTW